MLGDRQISGLEILSQLAEERGNGVRLAGRLAGIGVAVVMMVVSMTGAHSRASLLQIQLDGGEIRLGGRKVSRFQILRQLRNGGCERIAAVSSY
jgi:hypothetical protein